jgi:group II intron reverse transcriptase/maturase
VDRQSLDDFAQDERNNLYKIWNRMSSGTYFPPPVRVVEIPKAAGGVRRLGVPTVADRIAQTAVAMTLGAAVEPVFHPDSFGYRPKRSALDAVGVARQRCWSWPWVLDVDIRGFFDNVPHAPILWAVRQHTDVPWVLLYVRRWLAGPIQQPDGTVTVPERGTPQGSPISPLLSNLFMHYAFDEWITKTHDDVRFERYCDDIVVHCRSESHAAFLRGAITRRLGRYGLELHREKTRIVYCYQDGRARRRHADTRFTFLGYTFGPRTIKTAGGALKTGFVPAVSKESCKAMSRDIRGWSLGRRTDLSLDEVAAMINPIVTGWINYYGRFYKSLLIAFLGERLNPHLVKWVHRKYKRLHRAPARARRRLARIAAHQPGLFAHWRHGAIPTTSTTGAV